MAVTLIERHDSRSYTLSALRGSGAWKYTAYATGEADPESAVRTAVLSATQFYWMGMARRELEVNPIGGGWYEVSVPYSWEQPDTAAQDPTQTPDPSTGGPGGGPPSGTPSGPATADTPLGPNISLEIGGRPPALTTSRNLVFSEMAGGGLAPNHGRIINYNRVTNEVDGTEVDDSSSVLNIDHLFDYVTPKFVELLFGAVWKKNHATWYHFAPGSVAFLGVTLQSTDDGRARAGFKFGLRQRETILAGQLRDDAEGSSAGPDDDGANLLPTSDTDKKGWDYLEIQFENATDSETGLLVAKPMAMRIHELLPDFDFTLFGIGGGA